MSDLGLGLGFRALEKHGTALVIDMAIITNASMSSSRFRFQLTVARA